MFKHLQRWFRGDIVNSNAPMGISNVRIGHRFEPLLSCCIPNLKLAHFLINFHVFDLKINPNRGPGSLIKNSIAVLQKQRSFARTGVTDQNDFKHGCNFGVHRGVERHFLNNFFYILSLVDDIRFFWVRVWILVVWIEVQIQIWNSHPFVWPVFWSLRFILFLHFQL